ncbi:Protein CBG02421 [Caenorhabditis briggsae]|uniref:Protein CBG02421 n=1 Tax=Caenorhabditis briggsae TaxID=6238 RepID=A8WUC7_CAEBR|nr:Protein CBG02421 [Caenorhabditis briggsae]CAP24089.1 Protein CBG02421 [Caenorhabditis briggsae]
MTKAQGFSQFLKCAKCLTKFKTEAEFQAHTAYNCEIGDEYFKCNGCLFKTKSKAGIVSHQLGHSREGFGKIFCTYCRKYTLFKSQKNLMVNGPDGIKIKCQNWRKEDRREIDAKTQKMFNSSEKQAKKLANQQQPGSREIPHAVMIPSSHHHQEYELPPEAYRSGSSSNQSIQDTSQLYNYKDPTHYQQYGWL